MAVDKDFTQFVNPWIGTGGHGHVFLGANVPLGLVQLGPTEPTRGWDWCSGYHYSDSVLVGFSMMHLSGTGIGDLGDITLLPTLCPEQKDVKFSHLSERVRPGYYSVMLDGGIAGLHFLFHPDFSKITPQVILNALGLSFFTLSIGMGILVTYGGYMPKDQNVATTSMQMIVLVMIVSLLAGTIIFPAVFAYGFSPTEGPELTFITLPEVFQNTLSPTLTSVAFFALMCMAAITSTISLMEVMVAFFCEATAGTKCPLNRHQSVIVVGLIQVTTNILCILSITGHADWLTIMGKNLFDNFNDLVTNFLMPLGVISMALFTGWFVPQTRYQGSRVVSFVYLVLLRWIIPIAIIIVFLNSLNIL
jgi:NSS family neurotransmitter:Na+ symporter